MHTQYALGNIYNTDDPRFNHDYLEALKWWRRAAEQESVEAQFSIGYWFYYLGFIKQDYPEAYFWFAICTANPHKSSDEVGSWYRTNCPGYRDQVAQKISLEEKAVVDRRVGEWKATPAHAAPP